MKPYNAIGYDNLHSSTRAITRVPQKHSRITRRIPMLVTAYLSLLLTACPQPPDEVILPRNTTIDLEVVETWTTSITLKISIEDTTQAWSFALSRDDSQVASGAVFGRDTTLTDLGLEPKRGYSYRAYFREGAESIDSSQALTANTLDTTSHDFSWVIDTLGEYGSVLNDVAIVGEDDIWVVGEIIMEDPDSSYNGTGRETFNAAHWDGNEWEYLGIYSNTLELFSIFYFTSDDIWVTDYCSPIHWDGTEWTLYHLQNMGLDACAGKASWGSSSSNMYFVGSGGGIVHYDGAAFVKMESGTDVRLRSVHGSAVQYTDDFAVWASGWGDDNIFNSPGVLLKLTPEIGWQKIIDQVRTPFDVYSRYLFSSVISLNTDEIMITANASVYNLYTNGMNYQYTNSLNQSFAFIYGIAGNSKNDLMIAGDYVNLWHYNGYNWHNYTELNNPNKAILYGIDFKQDVSVAVGNDWTDGDRAIVYRGTRQD